MSVRDDFTAPRRRLIRTRAWLLAALAILAALLAAAWLQRADIARGYADDALAARGVPASYRIADLGFGGQRLTDVVLGDPAHPDLTADWVETRTRFGLSGPRVVAIRAGRVRLHGRIVDGRVSLGVVDKLLPPPTGAAFTFPDLSIDVVDGRMRLDTRAGPIGLKLSGSGPLRDGFAGTVAAVAPGLMVAGCSIKGATAFGKVAIGAGTPRFAGPVRVGSATCDDYRARDLILALDARLTPGLKDWRGRAGVRAAAVRGPRLWLTGIAGTIGFAGDSRATIGQLDLAAGPSTAFGASAAGLGLRGDYRVATRSEFSGSLDLRRASLPVRWRDRIAGWRGSAEGTPVGPLLDRAAGALGAASRDVRARAGLRIATGADGWAAGLTRLTIRSASGAQIDVADGTGMTLRPAGGRIDGTLTFAGGGLPEGRIVVTQGAPGAPLIGTARFAPYTAGTAQIALTPVSFRVTPGGRTFFTTHATLSGPIGDGRIDGMTLPLQGGWDGHGRLVVNPRCAPLGLRRVALVGVILRAATLDLCPVGGALLSMAGGRVSGGARIVAPRLGGTLGNSAFTAAANGADLHLADGALSVERLALRLGTGDALSRLDLATLSGRVTNGGIVGHYANGRGKIGAVPLLMSDAAGDWALRDGVLTVGGGMTVADAQAASPRLNPLPVRGIRLRLAGGRIVATGQVRGPDDVVRIADVTIAHDLARSTGEARIAVPGVTFTDRLRPEQLTPVTFGVVAGVTGTVSGNGVIRWSPAGVTSSGTFGTDAMDLAAAFGPVSGLKTTIHFTDLLALESAPGQVATVKTVNPGVPVSDGVFRYQTLSGARVRVEGARWPLAGGELLLEPTLFDFSAPVERRMTFRIVGLDARRFLQTFDYDNLDASGIFDGELPIVFDVAGGRLENGRLSARAGGTIAYRGEVSKENLGVWGNLAFGALRSLKFRALDLTLDGPLAGNIVTRARFAGVAQGEGTTSNFLTRRLAKLPFVFNVRIEAPFRSLIGSVRSLYDPSVLIEQNLPALIREQDRAPSAADRPFSRP